MKVLYFTKNGNEKILKMEKPMLFCPVCGKHDLKVYFDQSKGFVPECCGVTFQIVPDDYPESFSVIEDQLDPLENMV